MPEGARSTLFVEGEDDRHAIEHLLLKRRMRKEAEWFPALKPVGSVEELLATVEDAVMAGTGDIVGFVPDANGSPADRWHDVARELAKTGMKPPNTAPGEGYIDFCDLYRTRVGVWVMPDNKRPGAIEEFLLALIDPADPLLDHSERAAAEALALGAAFPESTRKKAELRAWLAWQENPGFPYGRALARDYFDSDRSAADPFVDWFTRLFRRPAGQSPP